MKIAKKILRYIIAIILTLLIIILVLVSLTSSTIANKNYIYKKLEEADYYTKIYEMVKSNFENYIYQSGLDPTVLQDIVPEKKVREDTNTIIDNIYAGLEEKIETDSIKDNLNANIEKSLGKTLNATQRQAVDTLINEILKEYTNTILHFNFENEINKVYQKAMKYVDLAKKVIIIAIAVCILLLIGITMRRIYRIFNFLGISCISSGLFLVIVNLFINQGIKVQHITILNDGMSIVIRNILLEILNSIMLYGYILIGIGFMSVIGTNLIHNIRKYKN